MSSNFPQRSAIVKIANPNADSNALMFPTMYPAEKPSTTMTEMPNAANNVAIQVLLRTDSRNINQPKSAAKNGADANKNIAFATVVVCIA